MAGTGGFGECTICFDADISTAAVPCGHIFACEPCIRAIVSSGGTCSICRGAFLHTKPFVSLFTTVDATADTEDELVLPSSEEARTSSVDGDDDDDDSEADSEQFEAALWDNIYNGDPPEQPPKPSAPPASSSDEEEEECCVAARRRWVRGHLGSSLTDAELRYGHMRVFPHRPRDVNEKEDLFPRDQQVVERVTDDTGPPVLTQYQIERDKKRRRLLWVAGIGELLACAALFVVVLLGALANKGYFDGFALPTLVFLPALVKGAHHLMPLHVGFISVGFMTFVTSVSLSGRFGINLISFTVMTTITAGLAWHMSNVYP